MARQYQVTPAMRVVNTLMSVLNRFGLGGGSSYTLTTTGRKSGQDRSTPITLATVDGDRYLVAPYGEVGWVHNVRASGTATLSRRGRREEVEVEEVSGTEAGRVLKHYVHEVRVVRPYFDAAHDAPVEEFAAEAARHPVFRVRTDTSAQ